MCVTTPVRLNWSQERSTVPSVLGLTVADLIHRRRQFLIAVLGAALVLGMALVMSGMSNSFRVEIATTIDDVGADAWVIAEGASGPTTGFAVLPVDAASQFATQPGVERADPMVFAPQTAIAGTSGSQINVFGHVPDGLGTPEVTEGRAATAPGEIVLDRRFGAGLGDQVTMGGRTLEVVGRTSGHSMFGGIPNAYVALEEMQALLFGGQPLHTIVAVVGEPAPVPGTQVMTNPEVRTDSLRTMGDAIQSVDTTQLFMWAVAVVIVAGLMYVSALERSRDFAVMKAMGASSGYVFATQAVQAVVIALLAAAIGILIAVALTPVMSLPVVVSSGARVAIPFIAVAVGIVSSLAGLRRAVTADPALAFS